VRTAGGETARDVARHDRALNGRTWTPVDYTPLELHASTSGFIAG